MFYEICSLVTIILFAAHLLIKKMENKVMFSFVHTVLLCVLLYWKVDMVTALIVLLLDLVTKFVLLAFTADFQDELSFKRFYLCRKKLLSFLVIIMIGLFIAINANVVDYIIKREEVFNFDIIIGLVIIVFTIFSISKRRT
jgi:hypothetical protein